MANLAAIPVELNFLHEALGDRKAQYRRAFWLKNEFADDVWECNFGKSSKRISFRIILPDGKSLTDPKHAILLDIFKCFLCIQTHPDATGGVKLSSASAHKIVNYAIKLIDYLLLNAEQYQLHQHGLSLLTESELTAMLFEIGSCNETHQTIYRWRERLSHFLKSQIKRLDQKKFSDVIAKVPALIENGFPKNNRMLDLNDDELVQARAWIYLNGFYYTAVKGWKGFHIIPSNAKFAALIYANTLNGNNASFPQFPELGIEPAIYATREYPAVAVRTENSKYQMIDRTFSIYCKTLRHLGLLHSIGLPVPSRALKIIKQQPLIELLKLKQQGRFRTLPSHIVFSSLRQAIDFCMTYGKELIDSYLTAVKAANADGKTLFQWQCENVDIIPYMTPAIQALGVKRWLIREREGNTHKMLDNSTYYPSLRANEGLWELLCVFYGSVQVIVGTLMARRQRELIDLLPTKCLDKHKRHLVFFACKSGHDGNREKNTRPIPKIASNLIQLCEHLQTELISNGIIDRYHSLFAYPQSNAKGLVNFNATQFNQSLDYFCDYMETSLNQKGHRYYIRQHQLRRFFAMLFFWGSSFGGMDTLRWFFGHTDVEHLYHYITESTPGSVLRGAEAHYATEQVQSYNKSADELANLLEHHFGTRKFSLMDTDELDEYIEELIEEGHVTVKPVFFENMDGRDYRILIIVNKELGIPSLPSSNPIT